MGSFGVDCCPDDIEANIHNQLYVLDSSGWMCEYDKQGKVLFQIELPFGHMSGIDVANNGSMLIGQRAYR
jgi:hypothetical protein